MKSVCFYSPYATSLFDEAIPGGHGGSELVMFFLACTLSKRPGFEVHFLLSELPVVRQDGCDITVHALERGVAKGKGPRGISVFTNAARAVRPFVRTGADTYVLAGASITLGYVALYRRLRRDKRVVFIVASDADVDGAMLRPSRFERYVFRLGLKLADVVWCQNNYQIEAVEKRFGRPARLLPNGLPVPGQPPDAEKRHVLWVASCQPLKQPHVYLDLAQALPGQRFVMIMPPRKDDSLFSEVRARALTLKNVEFIEGVHFRQIQRYFDEAMAFVNTSTIEGYPNTFVQSMIGATPILSLNVDPNGILSEHGLGLHACGDPSRLQDDLVRILADDVSRSEMGARAFEYARDHHDIRSAAERFSLYL